MTRNLDQTVRTVVCQRGARHRYAVPRLLEESGMLTALYTDSTVHSHAGFVARALARFGLATPRLKALIARAPAGVPREKIFCTDRLLYPRFTKTRPGDCLSPVFKKWGLRGANVVYSMCGEEFPFLEWAREQGAKIVIDVFVHPGTARIVEEESIAVTGRPLPNEEPVELVEKHFRRSFELADVILCPSNWVASGARAYAPQYADKIRVVPYGSSLRIKKQINSAPNVGSVLFAGREPLRKGVHHLARAARLLKDRGVNVDVRLAGVTAQSIEWMDDHDALNCLGTLPMDKMHKEFESADVFVLPSLSEGQAGVLLEAMASGCPVIASAESGVDFEPGCGITIPLADAEALADAIEEVVTNREKRDSLAAGALRQAEDFCVERWKSRLMEVMQEAVSA